MYLIPQDEIRERREKFLDKIEGGVCFMFSPSPKLKARDVEYKFRQDADLVYITGIDCEDVAVILSGIDKKFIVFIPPEDVWKGRRIDENRAKELGADEVYPKEKLEEVLEKKLEGAEAVFFHLGKEEEMDRFFINVLRKVRGKIRLGIKVPQAIVDPGTIISKMRQRKSENEIELIKKACSVTASAFHEVSNIVKPGTHEFEIEAVILSVLRKHGAEPAFTPVVASGRNSSTLHYTRNEEEIKGSVVLDAGAEFSHYCSDVTRTFNAPQYLYEAVAEVQKELLLAIRPGIIFGELHEIAVKLIIQKLKDLGLLKGNTDEIIEKEKYKEFFPHRVGHWLGMDVHDVGDYTTKFEEGMVLTVEPGIYTKDVGVRIEDDVLITKDGNIILTESIPK